MEYLAIKGLWRRTLDRLNDTDFRRVIEACLDYALTEKYDPKLAGLSEVQAIAFAALSSEIAHAIDVSKKRSKARKTKPNKTEQTKTKGDFVCISKSKSKSKQSIIDTSATARARGKTPPTLDQFIEGGKLAGVPAEFAREFYAEINGNGWRDSDGRYIGNWRMYLRSAYAEAQKKSRAARESSSTLADIPIAK